MDTKIQVSVIPRIEYLKSVNSVGIPVGTILCPTLFDLVVKKLGGGGISFGFTDMRMKLLPKDLQIHFLNVKNI